MSKDGKSNKVFDVLEWLAAIYSHVPDKGERPVILRYYGYYSNVSRGKRQKKQTDDIVPCIIESARSSKEQRKKWSRLIQKIYETDPLICPECRGPIISAIEDREIIKAILKHLGLWLVRSRPPLYFISPEGSFYQKISNQIKT